MSLGARVEARTPSGRFVLVGVRQADHLEWHDLQMQRTRRLPLGERLRGSETLSLHFSGDVFVVVTENGVLAIEPSGRERWRISETTYGWRLLDGDDDALWLADVHDNVFAIDPESGEEASV